MTKKLLIYLGGCAVLAVVVVLTIRHYVDDQWVSNFLRGASQVSTPPPPPEVEGPVLRRHLSGVERFSARGNETYEIRGALAPQDPEKHWELVIDAAATQNQATVVNLNDCLGQVGVSTDWTTLKSPFINPRLSDAKVVCGTHIEARCLKRADADCQPATPATP